MSKQFIKLVKLDWNSSAEKAMIQAYFLLRSSGVNTHCTSTYYTFSLRMQNIDSTFDLTVDK